MGITGWNFVDSNRNNSNTDNGNRINYYGTNGGNWKFKYLVKEKVKNYSDLRASMGSSFEALSEGKKLALNETAMTTRNILMTDNGVKT